MQPKVSKEILSSIRVAKVYPPEDSNGIWAVSIETDDTAYSFQFNSQTGAEQFFATLVVTERPVEKTPTGEKLYTREQVKEIVDAAVIPVIEPLPEEPPVGRLASFWQKVRTHWKNVTIGVGVLSVLLSSVVTLKVALGPVKIPEIVITLPDGSVVPTAKVETHYKTPVTNGLKD